MQDQSDHDDGVSGKPWTEGEVRAAVATYFLMLRLQEMGQRPNKAEHNRRLRQALPARNIASIEYKHRNISAVLNMLNVQSLAGYRPLPNFQRILVEIVGETLSADRTFDEVAMRRVEDLAEAPLVESFEDFVVNPPKPTPMSESRVKWISRSAVKRDYLEREARNRALGLAGELLVIEYETHRLHAAGAVDLAKQIEHVSQVQGDGLGYDILSFEPDGRERFIEVKTTAYAAETPFFVSQNEVQFSIQQSSLFHLYRVFSFREAPQMFVLPGAIDGHCQLDPVGYRATLSTK